MLPVSTTPGFPVTFDVPIQDPQAVLRQIHTYAAKLAVGGDTAVYDALVVAYQLVAQQATVDPDRITTIVLLTDGENNTGRDLAAFTAFYHALPAATASTPVFPILFGNAGVAQMQQLAQLTGGQTFDGHSLPLTTVLRLIRGDQ